MSEGTQEVHWAGQACVLESSRVLGPEKFERVEGGGCGALEDPRIFPFGPECLVIGFVRQRRGSVRLSSPANARADHRERDSRPYGIFGR